MFYWDIIVKCTHDLLVAEPICQDNLMSTIKHGGFYICLVEIEFKFTVFFYDFQASIEIHWTGTAISGFAFDCK